MPFTLAGKVQYTRAHTDNERFITTGAVNQLLQMIHSSNDALVHHASRALAEISKSAALARRLCDMQLKLSVTNLIQVRIISGSGLFIFRDSDHDCR